MNECAVMPLIEEQLDRALYLPPIMYIIRPIDLDCKELAAMTSQSFSNPRPGRQISSEQAFLRKEDKIGLDARRHRGGAESILLPKSKVVSAMSSGGSVWWTC